MGIIKKIKPQVEQVEVVNLQSETTTIGYENNRLKSSQTEETRGTAVRVVKNGRLGFSASSDAGASDKLITNVLESAEYGDEVPISFPAKGSIQEVKNYDQKIADLTIPQMVEIGQSVLDLLLGFDPELKVNVNVERENRSFSIQNQTGSDLTDQKTPLSILFEVVRVQGDDVLILFDIAGTTLWQEDYLAPAKKIGKLLKMAETSGEIKSGRMPVLFSPKGSLALSIPIMAGLDGKMAYTGISPLAAKVGEKIFDSKITIIDDPTLHGRFNSAPFDDEGVATRQNILIDQGELKSFYYDLKTAALNGTESTGNGSRGLFNPPSPSVSNFIVKPGETALADMIAGIDEGLWVEDVIGLGQGNVVSGAFSNTLSLAYKIEKGEITGRVKDVSIAGNIYDLLPNVAAVSKESEWVYNNYSQPYILLDDMNVVAKE